MVRDWCLTGHGTVLRSLYIAPQLYQGTVLLMSGMPGRPQPPSKSGPVARRIRLLVDSSRAAFPWKSPETRLGAHDWCPPRRVRPLRTRYPVRQNRPQYPRMAAPGIRLVTPYSRRRVDQQVSSELSPIHESSEHRLRPGTGSSMFQRMT
jgi:hypothetical protein